VATPKLAKEQAGLVYYAGNHASGRDHARMRQALLIAAAAVIPLTAAAPPDC
jgi:hypothetical protein